MKTVIKRDWNVLAPKVLAFLITGLTASALIAAGQYVGIEIPQGLASLIVTVVSLVAGYIKSDVVKTTASAPGNDSVAVATEAVAEPTNVVISTVTPTEDVTK